MVEDKTEEELKIEIFNNYKKSRNESFPDQKYIFIQKIYNLLLVYCKNFLFGDETIKFGLEIYRFAKNLVCPGSNSNIPNDFSEFILYFFKSLHNAKKQYYRKYPEKNSGDLVKIKSSVSISREMMQTLIEIDKYIKKKEQERGEEFKEYEVVNIISLWLNISEKKAREYKKNIALIKYEQNTNKTQDSSETDYIAKYDLSVIRTCLENLIKRKRKGAKDRYRALVTLWCVKNINKNIEELYPVLDKNILEICKKNKKKPTQPEVYLMFPSKAGKKSAESRASAMEEEFLIDLVILIKEKKIKENDSEYILNLLEYFCKSNPSLLNNKKFKKLFS